MKSNENVVFKYLVSSSFVVFTTARSSKKANYTRDKYLGMVILDRW